MSVINTRISGPNLARFVDYYSPFAGPERFPQLTIPEVRLRVGHQHSLFWSILTRFIYYYSLFWGPKAISMIWVVSSTYYSPFWGPKAISMIDDPRGAFTCRSSTLAVLADYGPFLGLLVTVLGSKSDFHN